MKRKFSKILGVGLTLALLTSLLLTAAPVSALTQPSVVPSSATIGATTSYAVSFNLGKELPVTAAWVLEERGDATTTWVTNAPTGYTGTTALKFTTITGSWNDMAKVHVVYDRALDTITEADLSFTYYSQVGAADPFPALYLDTNNDGLVDWALGGKRLEDQTAGQWVTTGPYVSDAAYPNIWRSGAFNFAAGVFSGATTWDSLATVKAAKPGAKILYVSLEYGDEANAVLYVDKITIKNSVYDLEELSTPHTITITFPSTTVVPTTITGATIVASPGWIGGQWDNATTDNVTFAGDATKRTVTATLGGSDEIGEGATVRVQVPGITNPPAVGSYNLTVKTSKETTAVASAAYSVTAPTILPLPGVVERYNSVGVLMAQTSSIQAAINSASAGDSINVGAGTYDEDIDVSKSVTITGTAATTIIKDTNSSGAGGTVTISYVGTATTGAVFDGFTIMGRPLVDALTITGHKATVRNCIFTKAGTATTAAAQDMIYYNPGAPPTLKSTITNCIFDTTLGTVVDNGVRIAAGADAIGLTVSSCTFTVDGAIALEDSAVDTSGIGTTSLPIKISGNTITGASGIGVTVTAGVATITDNTLTGLNQAFNVVSGTATIKGNTIDNCGLAIVTTTAPAGKAAINVTAATALSITNNNIINGPNDIIEITDNSENINMIFNNLTDNAKGIDNNDADTAMTLNATHNWWGAATGPATGFNVTAGAVNDTTAYLGGEAIGSFALASASLITKTTVGVDVTTTPTTGQPAPAIIGVANYAANPQDATPLPAIAGGFYDVYLAEATAGDTASVLIKFYNANVTANTDIYVWGTVAGGWAKVSAAAQGVNLYGGYAYATITATTTPAITDLAGTPFALVGAPLAALTAPVIISPDRGERDIPLTPTFSWTQIAAAAGYYFEFADNANFVAPLVKLDGDLGRLNTTAYAYVTTLPYSKAYYWRVKAVSGTEAAGDLAQSAWVSAVFITMDEPEEPTPPIVIEEAPILPDITIEQPDITITSPDIVVPLPDVVETPITPTWIYVIIGVGAVLVIALLVLIVRTRRVA